MSRAFSVGFRICCVVLISLAVIAEEHHFNGGTFGASAEDAEVASKGAPVSFGADVSKILGIVITNLYTNRNIFLREIISNGSDALSKIRLLYISNPKEPVNESGVAPTMDIRIRVDKEKRQFIMTDGGIGMTKEELEGNLGSLGSSGTKKFLEERKGDTSGADADYIGQFGVGFYSVFLVADHITVASRSDNGDGKQWIWESAGDGTYYIYEDKRGNTLGRGTELTLHLKKDADEYLDIEKIKEIIHKYSEFVNFPIYVQTSKTEKVPKAKATEDAEKKEDDAEKSEEEKEKEEEKEEEMEEVTTYDWELVNENKPIWTRKPNEITEEEYNKFYKSLTKDYADPLFYHHFSAEGGVDFTSILFIPSKGNMNMYDPSQVQNNIRLFVRRIFITDEFRDLLPRYLSFIKGVVDSDDLPINVSREQLQEHRILKVIKKKLVRKSLSMISEIAEHDAKKQKKEEASGEEEEDSDDKSDEEAADSGSKKLTGSSTYAKFWEEYGKNIRLGIIEDGNNRARLTKLLRYKTSKSEQKVVSFQQYVDRMPKTQKSIFYISGESIEKIKQSPVLEDATKRDVEVIYMLDAIDEYVVGHITDFSGRKLVNLAKEGGSLHEESKGEKAVAEKRKEKYEPLFKYFKDTLGEKVTKVVITKRTTSEPIILSSRQHDITARMASIIRGQALGGGQGAQNSRDHDEAAKTTKRVMEINHLHPLIDEVFRRVQADPKDPVAEDITLALFDTANLQNGFDIEDTLAFSKRIGRLLRSSVDIAADAPMIEEDLSQYEVEAEEEEEGDDKEDSEEDSKEDAKEGDEL